jgi:hypothetical protein
MCCRCTADLLQVYHRYAAGVLQTCYRCIADVLQVYCRRAADILQMCCGYTTDVWTGQDEDHAHSSSREVLGAFLNLSIGIQRKKATPAPFKIFPSSFTVAFLLR